MDNSTRQRRVNIDGEWEYLCVSCDDWKLKERFKGCIEKVDGFGNCHTCRSCIALKANETRISNDEEELEHVMKALGYETGNPDNPVWVQFHKKHNFPINI